MSRNFEKWFPDNPGLTQRKYQTLEINILTISVNLQKEFMGKQKDTVNIIHMKDGGPGVIYLYVRIRSDQMKIGLGKILF